MRKILPGKIRNQKAETLFTGIGFKSGMTLSSGCHGVRGDRNGYVGGVFFWRASEAAGTSVESSGNL